MACISLAYIDYELAYINDFVKKNEILTVLLTSFVISGMLVVGFSTVIVIAMTHANRQRIDRLEWVLAQVAEGKLSSRTGETHKVNDLARIEVAVDAMLARLEGSVTAMSDISGNIAHELKTPITRLQHNLINLKDTAELLNIDDSTTFNKELDLALSESTRLVSIFDALLRISQIESGARRNRFNPIDLNEILTTIADIYVEVAEDAQMTLSIKACKKPAIIQGDKELLIQQLANLIENSLRYCPMKSQITLSCEIQHAQAILLVRDNGVGIIEAEKKRVFERLYRVDNNRADTGLGLGLSLAKAVAGLHYGDIELYDNQPGLGVKITLPLAKIS